MGKATVEVQCDCCGKMFFKELRYIKHNSKDSRYKGRHYCGYKCFGRFLGNNYGFRVNPQNRIGNYKHDRALVWKRHLETGYGASKLSCLLNIPIGTIDSIIQANRKRLLGDKYGTLQRKELREIERVEPIEVK